MVGFFDLPLAIVFGHLKVQDLFTSIWFLNKRVNQILKSNPITFLNAYATQWSLNPEHLNPLKDWREEAKFRLGLELMNMLPHTFPGFVTKAEQLRLSAPPLQQYNLAFLVDSAQKHLKWTTNCAEQLGKYFASQHRVMAFEIDPLLKHLNVYPVTYNCTNVSVEPSSPSKIYTLSALMYVFDKHGDKRKITYQHKVYTFYDDVAQDTWGPDDFTLFYDNTCICSVTTDPNDRASRSTYFNDIAFKSFKQDILLDFGLAASDITFLSLFLLTFMSAHKSDVLYYSLEDAFNDLVQLIENRDGDLQDDITQEKQQEEDSKRPQISYNHSWANLLPLNHNQTLFKLWDKMDDPTITQRINWRSYRVDSNNDTTNARLQILYAHREADTLYSTRAPFPDGDFSFPSFIQSLPTLQENHHTINHASKLFRAQFSMRHSAEMWLKNLLQFSSEDAKKANKIGLALMTKLVEEATIEVSYVKKNTSPTDRSIHISSNSLFGIRSPFTGELCTFRFFQEYAVGWHCSGGTTTLWYGNYNLAANQRYNKTEESVLTFSNLLEQPNIISEAQSPDVEKAWIIAKMRQDLFGDSHARVSEWILLSFIFTLARSASKWKEAGSTAVIPPTESNLDDFITRPLILVAQTIKGLSHLWELSYSIDLNDIGWKISKEQKEKEQEDEQNKRIAAINAQKAEELRKQQIYAEQFSSDLLISDKYKYCANSSRNHFAKKTSPVVVNRAGSFLSNDCLFYTDMSIWPPLLVRNPLPCGVSKMQFSSTSDIMCGQENRQFGNRNSYSTKYRYHIYKTCPPSADERYRVGKAPEKITKLEICGFLNNILVGIDDWGNVWMQQTLNSSTLQRVADLPKCDSTSLNRPTRGVVMQLPPCPSPIPFSLDVLVINGTVYLFNPTTSSFSELVVVDEQNQNAHVGDKKPIVERMGEVYHAHTYMHLTLTPLSYKNPATNSLQCFYVFQHKLFELVWKDSTTLLRKPHELPELVVNPFVAGELGIIYGATYKGASRDNRSTHDNYMRSFVIYNPNTRIRKVMQSSAFGAGLGTVDFVWSDATHLLVAVKTEYGNHSSDSSDESSNEDEDQSYGRRFCMHCRDEIGTEFYKKDGLRMHDSCYEGLDDAEQARLNFTKHTTKPKLLKARPSRGRTRFYALPATAILQYPGDMQPDPPAENPPVPYIPPPVQPPTDWGSWENENWGGSWN